MRAQPRPLIEVFSDIADFRQARGKRHPLSAVLALVERFVSLFQVKLLVAGKVEAHRAAVQMVWDAG